MNIVRDMTMNQIQLLRRYLATAGMKEEDERLPKGTMFLARGEGCVVTAFQSGKVLFQGRECGAVLEKADAAIQIPINKGSGTNVFPVVGGDESGKGDLFGPLVVAAFAARTEEERRSIVRAGARDCKLMTDAEVMTVEKRLNELGKSSVVVLPPEEYNRRYAAVHNINILLNELYGDLLQSMALAVGARTVILDKYGNRALSLWKGRPEFNFIVETHAEQYPEVAAASVLARAAFLKGLHETAREHALGGLPKGASRETQDFMRQLAKREGKELLRSVAKVNFVPVRDCLADLF